MLNISLIGAGFIGRVHARCIAANAATRLAFVHDLDESAAGALAERYAARVAGSIGEINGEPAVGGGRQRITRVTADTACMEYPARMSRH